ncbi:MAG: GbsR/MarR family transcriptional regulator [Egibacteraceae bacterium]
MATGDGLDQARSSFIDAFALLMGESGINRMSARVLAALLSGDEPALTAAQLSALLQTSPASISAAVRQLEQRRLVKRGRVPGTRADTYALAREGWYEAFAARSNFAEAMCGILDEGIAASAPDGQARARLRETRDFFAFLAKELPAVVDRWRALRREPPEPNTDR